MFASRLVNRHLSRQGNKIHLADQNLIFPVCRSKPLFSAVRDYLGVTNDHLPGGFQAGGGEFWLSRPLGDYFLMAAARETMYLLELSHIL